MRYIDKIAATCDLESHMTVLLPPLAALRAFEAAARLQ
ncbi:LysR family transcriptional regulator, partial [Xanthomonas oryzae pv. oryzae]